MTGFVAKFSDLNPVVLQIKFMTVKFPSVFFNMNVFIGHIGMKY